MSELASVSNGTENNSTVYDELKNMTEHQLTENADSTPKASIQTEPEEELVTLIESIGIPIEDKQGLLGALKNKNLVETQEGRNSIKRILNTDNLTADQLNTLVESGAKEKLNTIIALRMRELIHDILPVESLKPDNIIIIPELSDDLQSDPLAEIGAIIGDTDVSANQGMMQNVLISDRSAYVLKMLKPDLQDKNYARETLAHFEKAREAFGHDFFPKQIGFEIKDPPLVGTLQEKIQLDDYNLLSLLTDMKELESCLVDEDNKNKIRAFLQGFDRLSTQGLTLDLKGDNVMWRLDDKGLLDIKIVDSGLFVSEYGSEGNQQNIAEVNNFVDRLRGLVS